MSPPYRDLADARGHRHVTCKPPSPSTNSLTRGARPHTRHCSGTTLNYYHKDVHVSCLPSLSPIGQEYCHLAGYKYC